MKIRCLTKEHAKTTGKEKWICPIGHKFVDTLSNIKVRVKNGGHECAICNKVRKIELSSEKFLNEAKEISSIEGHTVLSNFINNPRMDKISFVCKKGHSFQKTIAALRLTPNCQICLKAESKELKNGKRLVRARRIADSFNGELLSSKVIGTHEKLDWRCGKGHFFNKAIDKILENGIFCNECFMDDIASPVTLEDRPAERTGRALTEFLRKKEMLRIITNWANKNGATLVSNHYTNNSEKLLWKCEKGHEFKANWSNVNNGHWCPYCAGRKNMIPHLIRAQKIAKERNGKCLTKSITTLNQSVSWECSEGHRWKQSLSNVEHRETWCPHCAGKAPLTLADLRATAASRGGDLLSTNYIDSKTKYSWKCSEGHEWQADANNVRAGKWCPLCSSSIGERLCREAFEQIFGNKFPSSRPKWLRSPFSGRVLELDGYCEKLNLAFEHQGYFHDDESGGFIGKAGVIKRKAIDDYKRGICQKRGVVLIEIPEVPRLIATDDLVEYIFNELQECGISIPKIDLGKIDLNRAYLKNPTYELKKLAKENNGELISEGYKGAKEKHKFKCKSGHIFELTPDQLKRGAWCIKCKGIILKYSIEDAKKFGISHGGLCLSKEYVNGKAPLLWKCVHGHIFEKTFGAMLSRTKSFCPRCSGHLQTVEDMEQLAEIFGGKFLSKKYLGSVKKHEWECKNGHRFLKSPNAIKSKGRWCPDCKK